MDQDQKNNEMAAWARKGGQSRSPAKIAAARRNIAINRQLWRARQTDAEKMEHIRKMVAGRRAKMTPEKMRLIVERMQAAKMAKKMEREKDENTGEKNT